MNKVTLITLVLLLGIYLLPAQISNYYVFSTTTETYSTITGTSVPTAIGNNVLSNPVDIGFSFAYGTNTYTQVKVSSNGYLTLGTVPGSTNYNNLGSTTCPVLAPLWDNTYLQGSAQYLVTGTAPNRVFTMQFAGVKWPATTVTNFNYQVRLYEDSKIEFIYGAGVGNPTNASASIGINMLPGGYNNFCSVSPGTPATASFTVENSNVNIWPGSNTKYTFSSPEQYTNDLAALSISGNQTPTSGISYNYSVAVYNNGSATQTGYTVNLMSGATQLATVTGTTVAPLSTVNVSVPWTPAAAGAISITAKVVLTGDENNTNNSTTPLVLDVQPVGTTALTIGDGSQTARKPIDVSYRNSMFQTIYPSSEITLNGTITGVSFYNNFVSDCPGTRTKIWLGTTTQTSLADGWIPAYQMRQVFDGTILYPSGENTIHITFNMTPAFNYTGGNLVMLVSRPMAVDYFSSQNVFQCQTIGSNRSRIAFSDATTYDPNSMGTVGTVSGQFPRTTLYMQAPDAEPAFAVNPANHNFGQVLLNRTASQSFSVYNSGGGTLNISSINITGSPFFNIQNLPTLPIALGSGQNTSFTVRYQPTAVGAHTGSIVIVDNLTRLSHTVNLSGSCLDPAISTLPHNQNFDNVTAPNLPITWQKLTTGTGTVTTVTTTPFSAPNSVLMNNSNSALGPFLISPPISASYPVNLLKIRFRAKGASGFGIKIGVMTDPLNANTFTELQSVTLSSEWMAYAVDLRTYTGTGNYIAFKHSQGGNNRNIYIDNVSIEALLQNDLAALTLSGNAAPNVGTTYNYSIAVYNWGLNAQSDYQVKLFKQGGVELASIPGPAIAGNTEAVVTIPWSPTVAETTFLYAKVVLAGDQNSSNDQTPNLNIAAQASETTLVVVGSGNQFDYAAPVNVYALSSLYENIYRQDELNNAGLITIVNFYNFFATNVGIKPTKIWLGMTEQTTLSAGWIPSNQLTLVFDGNVNYPISSNTISIQLQQPFTLATGYNLVMMVQRPLDTVSYTMWDSFLCQTDATARARIASGSVALDPDNPPVGTFTGQFPKTGFYITPGTAGNLHGVVYGADNQVLPNAQVRILNGPQTTTDIDGEYSFPNIFASDYTLTVSAHGYYDLTQYATVTTDATTELDFSLIQTPTVTVSGTIVGSDNATVGLAEATISLSGYADYEVVSNAAGVFSFTAVFADHSYDYQAVAEGYQIRTGTINLATQNFDMGTITLNERTYVPRTVVATPINAHSDVQINWLAPDPDATSRALTGYKVWRLETGQEADSTEWTLLTPAMINTLSFIDTAWDTLPEGSFRWAVKSLYTGDLISAAVFSNVLRTTGMLAGIVTNEQMLPLGNATVDVGTNTTTTADDGSYTLHLPAGSYSVVCSRTDYYSHTQHNVEMVVGETTQLNFTLSPISNTGTLLGVVKNRDLQPVEGAVITVGTQTATTVADGSYVMNLAAGSYSVICSHEDYFNVTQNNVVIVAGQTTRVNFTIIPVDNADDHILTATSLNSNYPNPFNPSTVISYDVKDAAEVFLAIYNVKGQLIRSLVNESKSAGRYTVEWDGKDQNGNAVGSGIYQYIMKAGKYQKARRMVLTK